MVRVIKKSKLLYMTFSRQFSFFTAVLKVFESASAMHAFNDVQNAILIRPQYYFQLLIVQIKSIDCSKVTVVVHV